MGVTVPGGALVSQVVPQSAGARAGMKDGDVIIALDGTGITSSAHLRNEIGQRRPGTNVRLTLLRDGKQQMVTATLDTLVTPASATPQADTRGDSLASGMTLGPIPPDDPNYGRLRGVYVESVDPGSAAEEAGIREGDIIIAADRKPVGTTAGLVQIIREHKEGSPLLLQVRRGDSALFVALE